MVFWMNYGGKWSSDFMEKKVRSVLQPVCDCLIISANFYEDRKFTSFLYTMKGMITPLKKNSSRVQSRERTYVRTK